MKIKSLLLTAAFLTAAFVIPAHALDYTVDAPSAGNFGTPTSDETIYVGIEGGGVVTVPSPGTVGGGITYSTTLWVIFRVMVAEPAHSTLIQRIFPGQMPNPAT